MPERRTLALWRGLDAWHVEAASIELFASGLVAEGTQIGSDPVAYRLDYRLDASENFVTRSLEVEATGRGWSRELMLRHHGSGRWSIDTSSHGRVALPDPGGDADTLDGALDCDLGRSPLTNMMPIHRSGLFRSPGVADFVMAWVSVPDLSVVASKQRYDYVGRTDAGAVVRFVDRGLFPGFTAELELDGNGLVTSYPGLAERVGDEPTQPAVPATPHPDATVAEGRSRIGHLSGSTGQTVDRFE